MLEMHVHFKNGDVYTLKVKKGKEKEIAKKIWETGYLIKNNRQEWDSKIYLKNIIWDGSDESYLPEKE